MYENNYENKGDRVVRIMSIALISLTVIMSFLFLTITGIFVSVYSNLVDLQENVESSKTNIIAMMQNRLDFIPYLVDDVESSTKIEKQVLKDISNARETLAESFNSQDLEKIGEANDNLTRALNELISKANANTEIKSSENYIILMNQLDSYENKIYNAREEYNNAVYEYNRNIQSFPGNIIAGTFGFEKIKYFEPNGQVSSIDMVN